MRAALTLAAAGEALTGLALLLRPQLVARLLLGVELEGVAIAVARVAGIAMIGLAVACAPFAPASRASAGMLTYSVLVTGYLVRLGVAGVHAGTLLWPAVGLHALLAVLILRGWPGIVDNRGEAQRSGKGTSA